jgi:protein-S-isoprenylcysteine O-methyltransferase Ste14
VGIFLGAKSLAVVFGRAGEKPKFTTTGVYAGVRHPMYLASLLILLSLFFATLSLLALLVWIGLFVFYDRMATYEERDLIRILGQQYVDYQKQVPKWLPHIRRGNK